MRGRQGERRDQGDDRSRRAGRLRRALLLLALASSLATRASASDCIDIALYGRVLQARTRAVPEVVGTRVDYPALRDDPEFAGVVRSLAGCDTARLATREEKLAFWINAYNILAMDLVAKHWQLASIRDIGSLLFPVWHRTAGEISGERYSLDQIENGKLRPLADPRIHAAIVCASISCPSLAREPYAVATIDAQLDAAFARFVSNPDKGFRLDRASKTIHLSSIFKWFAEDFEKQGGVLAVISRKLGDDDRAWLKANGATATLEYIDYDWRVNG